MDGVSAPNNLLNNNLYDYLIITIINMIVPGWRDPEVDH